MVKPYYEQDGITIYHGDCREILPTLEKVDLVLTDPPYVGLSGGVDFVNLTGVAKQINRSHTVGDIWNANHDWLSLVWDKITYGLIQFCSFKDVDIPPQLLPDATRIGIVTWYERNSPPSLRNRPHYMTQLIWLFEKSTGLNWHNLKTYYDIPKLQAGCMATERILNRDGTTTHPTQKPQLLMCELLKCTLPEHLILDPFLGLGTTAVAAKKLNRKCIGIEIEEKYCEIAAKRCSQSVMKLEVK